MTWTWRIIDMPEYRYTSSNQHGDCYLRTGTKRVRVCRLSTECGDVGDMRTLIILSNELDVPVKYDFSCKPQVAYMEVVSKRAIT